jgi:hypothetical protein
VPWESAIVHAIRFHPLPTAHYSMCGMSDISRARSPLFSALSTQLRAASDWIAKIIAGSVTFCDIAYPCPVPEKNCVACPFFALGQFDSRTQHSALTPLSFSGARPVLIWPRRQPRQAGEPAGSIGPEHLACATGRWSFIAWPVAAGHTLTSRRIDKDRADPPSNGEFHNSSMVHLEPCHPLYRRKNLAPAEGCEGSGGE